MKQPAPIQLSNEYVKLVPLESKHAADFYHAGKDDSLWRWVKPHQCTDLETAKKWVEQSIASTKAGEHVAFVIIDKATDQIVGSTRYCTIDMINSGLEIGFTFISPKFQRSHINTSAKFLLLEHAFDTLGAIRVQFKTHQSNQKSRNAISRLGAQFEGVLRNQRLFECGERRDTALFSITDGDWPQIKSILQAKFVGKDIDNTDTFQLSSSSLALIKQQPLAQIMLQTSNNLIDQIIHIPLYVDDAGTMLSGHVSRNNKLNWLLENSPQVVVVFHGEDGYVSPQCHAEQKVPTWNYQRLHLTGKFNFVADGEHHKKLSLLAPQVVAHESSDWVLSQQPSQMIERMSEHIRCFSIALTQELLVEKLSQKKSQSARQAIAQSLQQQGKMQLAQLIPVTNEDAEIMHFHGKSVLI